MRANNKYSFAWDEERCGFSAIVYGGEVAFYPANSRWDRSSAQMQAIKHINNLRIAELNADLAQHEHDYQYNTPLSTVELKWIELDKKIVRFLKDKDQSAKLTNDEFKLYEIFGKTVRRSIIDGTHPVAEYRAFASTSKQQRGKNETSY